MPQGNGPNWEPFEFYDITETLMVRGYFAASDVEDLIFTSSFE